LKLAAPIPVSYRICYEVGVLWRILYDVLKGPPLAAVSIIVFLAPVVLTAAAIWDGVKSWCATSFQWFLAVTESVSMRIVLAVFAIGWVALLILAKHKIKAASAPAPRPDLLDSLLAADRAEALREIARLTITDRPPIRSFAQVECETDRLRALLMTIGPDANAQRYLDGFRDHYAKLRIVQGTLAPPFIGATRQEFHAFHAAMEATHATALCEWLRGRDSLTDFETAIATAEPLRPADEREWTFAINAEGRIEMSPLQKPPPDEA
jgi:hypothetical protein